MSDGKTRILYAPDNSLDIPEVTHEPIDVDFSIEYLLTEETHERYYDSIGSDIQAAVRLTEYDASEKKAPRFWYC